jgi:hypothetical protein
MRPAPTPRHCHYQQTDADQCDGRRLRDAVNPARVAEQFGEEVSTGVEVQYGTLTETRAVTVEQGEIGCLQIGITRKCAQVTGIEYGMPEDKKIAKLI